MAFSFLPSREDMYKFRINLLVVASMNTCDALKTALLASDLIKHKPYKLKVHQTETCSSIPGSENLHVDFIVFVVDCRVSDAVKKVNEDVMILPPELSIGRFCVINAAFKDTPFYECSNTAQKLTDVFRSKYNAHIINGRFDAPEGISDVASRVLKLMSCVVDIPLNENILEYK